MVSSVTVLSVAAALVCVVFASPLPHKDSESDDAEDSAPPNYLNCATAVGQGNGLNNCSMPSMPEYPQPPAMPSMPSMPEYPQAPAMPSMPSMPEYPQQPSMPAMPSMPTMPEYPQAPAMPSMPTMPEYPQPPAMPQQPPQVSQGVDCATAVGQGNGFNNCTNIIQNRS